MIVRDTLNSPGDVREFIYNRLGPYIIDTFVMTQAITMSVRGRVELENKQSIEWENGSINEEPYYIVILTLNTPLKTAYYVDSTSEV